MKFIPSLITGAIAALLAAACTPYVEEPPMPGPDVARNNAAPDKEKKEGENMQGAEGDQAGDETASTGMPEEKPEITERADDPEPPKPEPKAGVQVARAVPGKPGFVFSPFNNKIIDVKGIPSGTLVADPTYPAAEKKYFRVP